MAETNIHPADFALIADLVRSQSGLVLEPGKEYLVQTRLTPLAQKHGLACVEQLINRLREGGSHKLKTEVVEAMVTTETSFFRDFHPFETLKQTVLPELISKRRTQRRLNIWCAASSSGQEPYSIVLLLKEYFPELDSWNVLLTGSDISHDMIERSRAGRYSQVEVNRGLPTTLLTKWFRQDGAVWELDERIRRVVSFTQVNLIQPLPSMPTWDLVCLRNVMIYFDVETRKAILGRVARELSNDGYLLLGVPNRRLESMNRSSE